MASSTTSLQAPYTIFFRACHYCGGPVPPSGPGHSVSLSVCNRCVPRRELFHQWPMGPPIIEPKVSAVVTDNRFVDRPAVPVAPATDDSCNIDLDFSKIPSEDAYGDHADVCNDIDNLDLVYPDEKASSATRTPAPSTYPNTQPNLSHPVAEITKSATQSRPPLPKRSRIFRPTPYPVLPQLPKPIPIPNPVHTSRSVNRSNAKLPSLPLWNSQPLRTTSQLTHPVVLPSIAKHNVRICTTPGCPALISPSSTASRCVKCVMTAWNSRKAKIISQINSSRSPPPSILRSRSRDKGKAKTVTWADIHGENQSRQHSPSLASSDEEEDFPRSPPSTQSWMSKIKSVRLILPENRVPDALHTPDDNTCGQHMPLEPAPCEDSLLHNQKYSDLSTELLEKVLLEDSDLSSLTELSSDDTSQSDSNGSTSDEDVPSVTARSHLIIRIPARAHKLKRCESEHVSPETLDLTYQYRQCALCQRCLPSNHDCDTCVWCHVKKEFIEERRPHTVQPNGIGDSQFNPGINFEPTPHKTADLVERELLAGDVVSGARICCLPTCQHIIPSSEEYPYNACFPCRITRSGQQTKFRPRSRWKGERDNTDDELSVSMPIEENSNPERSPGRCMSRDCGVLTDMPECWQCATRKWRIKSQRRRPQGPHVDSSEKGLNSLSEVSSEPAPCPRNEVVTPPLVPFPEYSCQQRLLADFCMKLSGFLEIQTIYSMHRPRASAGLRIFSFDGQFSVAARDMDIRRRKEIIEAEVFKLKGELERMGGLRINPSTIVTINEGSIFTRFMCLHRTINPVVPPLDRSHRFMQGELDIIVQPDPSHDFIPGQKTVVRFRLFG